MATIMGSIILRCLIVQVLTGLKVIKASYKFHVILGYVILGLGFLHGLGGIIEYLG